MSINLLCPASVLNKRNNTLGHVLENRLQKFEPLDNYRKGFYFKNLSFQEKTYKKNLTAQTGYNKRAVENQRREVAKDKYIWQICFV